jgi:16S rRNA (cytosine967-C5)-methyltransferase
LSDVLRKRRPLDGVLDQVLSTAKLDARDAGFARAIAVETLRRFGQLEDLIRRFVPKAPPPHKAGTALEILYAGACELLFLDVAAHAAVDAANRLAQGDSKAVHFKGLINAVLRRVSREGKDIVAAQDIALNAPDWLMGRWTGIYGGGEARAIVEAHLTRAPLDLTLVTPNTWPADLKGVHFAPDHLRLDESARVDTMPGFSEGLWFVQDFAASLPVRLLGDIKNASIIDLCSAPGGKTAQLAARGAHVTSLDLSPERLKLVKENLARLKVDARTIAADARDWRPAEPAPYVLLDAPCTATGTIRRHPDLPWIKSAADISAVTSLQSELLNAAAAMTARGGTLIYAVCSLEPEEGFEQIEDFLREREDFTRVPISADEVFGGPFVTAQGDLRTLPHHWGDKGGMDGFYAARLKRAN